MKSKLSPWTLNAKKWREENGYTTPEWEMYVMNRSNSTALTVGICVLATAIVCFIAALQAA